LKIDGRKFLIGQATPDKGWSFYPSQEINYIDLDEGPVMRKRTNQQIRRPLIGKKAIEKNFGSENQRVKEARKFILRMCKLAQKTLERYRKHVSNEKNHSCFV